MNILLLGLRYVLRWLYWPARAIRFCAGAAACGGVIMASELYREGNAASAGMSLLVAVGCVFVTGLLMMLVRWLDKPTESRT